jgi:hypothetical protein
LFNFVIPGAIGGDFVRAAYLCREQSRRAQPIASVFVDRLVGLIGLFVIGGITGALYWSQLERPVRALVTAAWIATAVTTAILALAFLPAIGQSGSSDHGHSKRLRTLRAELAAVGQSYRKHFAVIPLAISMGMLTHTMNVFAFHAVSQALFPRIPGVTEHFLIVPLVLFSTAVPLPFGALGVSEHISARLFRLASASTGAVAMMAFRILQLGGALIGAIVYLGNKSQVRALAETASHLDEELVHEGSGEGDPVASSSTLESPSDR